MSSLGLRHTRQLARERPQIHATSHGLIDLRHFPSGEHVLVGATPPRILREQDEPGGLGVEAVSCGDVVVGELSARRDRHAPCHIGAARDGGDAVRLVDDDESLGAVDDVKDDRLGWLVGDGAEDVQPRSGAVGVGGQGGDDEIVEDIAAKKPLASWAEAAHRPFAQGGEVDVGKHKRASVNSATQRRANRTLTRRTTLRTRPTHGITLPFNLGKTWGQWHYAAISIISAPNVGR